MPMSLLRAVAAATVAVLSLALPIGAQGTAEVDARRAEIVKQLVKDLVVFTNSATAQKAHSLARSAAQLLVEHYDTDNQVARRTLGQRKVRGEWQAATGEPPADAADERTRARLQSAWDTLRGHAGQLHRELAIALRTAGAPPERVRSEFELALRFVPDDREANAGLGRHEFHGYWGTADDVEFARRLQGIIDAAAALRGRDFEVAELPAAAEPEELRQMGVPFFGAKSKRYTYWSPDSYAAAANCCLWSERCHDLLAQLLGDHAPLLRAESWAWHCVLRTEAQRDLLFAKSPSTTGPFTADQAKLFAGIGFATKAGGRASATWQPAHIDADYAVANVTKRHLLDQRNEGLGEGLTHVTTWLLCGSTSTYFTDLPKTVVGNFKPMGRNPNEWFERLWNEIDAGKDQPLAQVPRELSDNFRDSTRLKAWSFLGWLLARHPDRWFALIDSVSEPRQTVETVEAAFAKVLGRPLADVEADWRRWAKRGSPLGKASGWLPRE